MRVVRIIYPRQGGARDQQLAGPATSMFEVTATIVEEFEGWCLRNSLWNTIDVGMSVPYTSSLRRPLAHP